MTDLYIEGVTLSVSWRDTSLSLTDLIFETVRGAVDDSGQEMESIDSVVLAAHDLVDGRSLSSMVTAPAAAAYLRDEIRYGDDGAGAFAAAMTRLEAGHNQRTVVAGWGRASEHDVVAFSHSLFDPFIAGPVGLDELAVSALRAQTWIQRHGSPDRERAAIERRARAARNPRSVSANDIRQSPPYPLTVDDLPRWADVAVGLVMSTEPGGVRVAGMGQSTDPYHLGDRDLVGMPALVDAVGKALAEAGTTVADLDVVEIDTLTGFDEALAVEAIGLTPPGTGFGYAADTPGFNPSGGSAAGYCAPAMGLARIAECVLQLRGSAGATQVDGARRALATGSSTIASQTHTAVVLEAS
ncbi:MAG: acetyl-CoA acetyltransferase [Nocardioidaceae bacterium]|nr:acetyl-CoA acetyltransferase [Nocardioidaceae bacterium]